MSCTWKFLSKIALVSLLWNMDEMGPSRSIAGAATPCAFLRCECNCSVYTPRDRMN